MTDREICEKIVRQGGCGGISCRVDKCPLSRRYGNSWCDVNGDGSCAYGAKRWLSDHAESPLEKAQRKLAKWAQRVKELEEAEKKVEYPCVMVYDDRDFVRLFLEDGTGVDINEENFHRSRTQVVADRLFSGTIRYKNGKPVETVEDDE